MKIGIDIEETERFKINKEDSFNKKVFTDAEINYAYKKSKPWIHLCGFFCAKEALKKTIEFSGLDYKEIEILHKENGKPIIKILNPKINSLKFEVSISHCNLYAIANVIQVENE